MNTPAAEVALASLLQLTLAERAYEIYPVHIIYELHLEWCTSLGFILVDSFHTAQAIARAKQASYQLACSPHHSNDC